MFIFLKFYYFFIPSFTYVCIQTHTCQGSHVNVCVQARTCHRSHVDIRRQLLGVGILLPPRGIWELNSGLSGLCASASAHRTIPPQDLLREISPGVWRWWVPGNLVICTLSLYLQEAHKPSVSWGLYTRNSLIKRRASFHNWGIGFHFLPWPQ